MIESFCEHQGQCPVTKRSATAINSNCSHFSNHYCPISQFSTKLCVENINLNVTEYCEDIDDYVSLNYMCPKAINGLIFDQCYRYEHTSSLRSFCIAGLQKDQIILEHI